MPVNAAASGVAGVVSRGVGGASEGGAVGRTTGGVGLGIGGRPGVTGKVVKL